MYNKDLKHLEVDVTAKCNKECHFCRGAEYMLLDDDYTAITETVLDNVLNKPTVELITFAGGEPLLQWRRVVDLHDRIKAIRPDMEFELLTNGEYLSTKHVELLSTFKRVQISVDGFKETKECPRGWESFISKSGFEAQAAMAALDNVHLWSVITNGRLWDSRWHEDIIKMLNNAYRLNFKSYGLVLDMHMPKHLFTDQVCNFTYGADRIMERLLELETAYGWLSPLNFPHLFRHGNCEGCACIGSVYPNGEFEQKTIDKPMLKEGCSYLADSIGPENHQYLLSYFVPKQD